MQFLKTLLWVVLAVVLVLFSIFNWRTVEIHLWGGLIADVRLPVLIMIAFLLGFAPMLGIHLAKLWSMRRKLEIYERQAVAAAATPAPPPAPDILPERDGDRIATDSKVWPVS